MKAGRFTQAFTLIELLVVLGLIAALSGGLGLALRHGNQSARLQAGQATLACLVAAARGEACLIRARVQLVVVAEPDDEEFLRRVILAAETSPGSDMWQCLDEGELLPEGVALVPEDLTLEGVAIEADAMPWPSASVSSLRLAPGGTVIGPRGGSAGRFLRMLVPVEPAASGRRRAEDRLVLAPSRRTARGVEFSRPIWARAVLLSEYGVAVCTEESAVF